MRFFPLLVVAAVLLLDAWIGSSSTPNQFVRGQRSEGHPDGQPGISRGAGVENDCDQGPYEDRAPIEDTTMPTRVAILTALIIAWQSFETRRAANNSERSATGAERTFREIERPILIIEPDGEPETLTRGETVGVPHDNFKPVRIRINLKATNIGRSPLWVVSEGIRWQWLPFAPGAIAGPYPFQGNPTILPARPIASEQLCAALSLPPFILDAGECRTILEDRASLLVYGMVTYRDGGERRYDAPFCYEYRRVGTIEGISTARGNVITGVSDWDDARWFIRDGLRSYFPDLVRNEQRENTASVTPTSIRW